MAGMVDILALESEAADLLNEEDDIEIKESLGALKQIMSQNAQLANEVAELDEQARRLERAAKKDKLLEMIREHMEAQEMAKERLHQKRELSMQTISKFDKPSKIRRMSNSSRGTESPIAMSSSQTSLSSLGLGAICMTSTPDSIDADICDHTLTDGGDIADHQSVALGEPVVTMNKKDSVDTNVCNDALADGEYVVNPCATMGKEVIQVNETPEQDMVAQAAIMADIPQADSSVTSIVSADRELISESEVAVSFLMDTAGHAAAAPTAAATAADTTHTIESSDSNIQAKQISKDDLQIQQLSDLARGVQDVRRSFEGAVRVCQRTTASSQLVANVATTVMKSAQGCGVKSAADDLAKVMTPQERLPRRRSMDADVAGLYREGRLGDDTNESPAGKRTNSSHTKKDITCKNCQAVFRNEYQLQRHCGSIRCIQRVAKKKRSTEDLSREDLQCPKCSKTFKSLQGKVEHCRQKCCEKEQDTRHLSKHDTPSTPERDIQCPTCSKVFKSIEGKNEHCRLQKCTKVQVQGEIAYLLCPRGCNKLFSSRTNADRHMKSKRCIGLDAELFRCIGCDDRFQSLMSLIYHVSVKHSAHVESIDGKKLSKREKNHIWYNRGGDVVFDTIIVDVYNPLQCIGCAETFETLQLMKIHHPKCSILNALECQVCGFKEYDPVRMWVHRSEHGTSSSDTIIITPYIRCGKCRRYAVSYEQLHCKC